jgi:hypothetical protein
MVSGQLHALTALPPTKNFPILIDWVGCTVCLDVVRSVGRSAPSGNRNTCRAVVATVTVLSYHSLCLIQSDACHGNGGRCLVRFALLVRYMLKVSDTI